jgi:hypothetical protein
VAASVHPHQLCVLRNRLEVLATLIQKGLQLQADPQILHHAYGCVFLVKLLPQSGYCAFSWSSVQDAKSVPLVEWWFCTRVPRCQ